MSDPITNVSGSSTAAYQAASRVPVQTLGQDEFLKILVTQLTTQDPMNPQKDTEFVAQMAQFSQLENGKSMTENLESLREQQDFLKANSLIGRQVEFADVSDLNFVGTVTGMEVQNGTPMLTVGDKVFSLDDVVRIEQAKTSGSYPK